MSKKNRVLKRSAYYLLLYASLFLGFFIMAFGIVLSLKTGLGISPWNVFHTGLLNYLPITFGVASILTGAVIITISVFLGVKPYIGTFLNMIFIGIFIDIINQWRIFSYLPDSFIVKLIAILFSVFLIALGSALYFAANLKYGPRDGLMMGICKKTGIRIGIIRTFMEVTVVIIGWAMGGEFGIGTIIYSFTIGFFLEITLSWVKKFKQSKLFLYIYDSLNYWHQGDGQPLIPVEGCHNKSAQ